MFKKVIITIFIFLTFSGKLFCQTQDQDIIPWEHIKISDQEIIKCNSKYGVLLTTGDTLIPCVYDSIIPFSPLFYKDYYSSYYVLKDSLWGVLSGQSQIVPNEFDNIIIESLTISVRKGRYWGLYNKEGQQLLPCQFYAYFDFKEGFAVAIKNNKYGFINDKGQLVIPMIYDRAFNFSRSLAAVEINDKWGFIDTIGKFIIQSKYDFVQSFYNGYAWFRVDSSINNTFYHGLIDRDGNEVYLNEFDEHDFYFSEGLLAVKKNQKWGFINFEKEIIVDFKYNSVSEFSEGYARVVKNGKIMYVNHKGKEFQAGIRYLLIEMKYNKNAL